MSMSFGGAPLDTGILLQVITLATVVYLLVRVGRLERMLGDRTRSRRQGDPGPAGDGKIIPILKDHIEPGPFKPQPPEKK